MLKPTRRGLFRMLAGLPLVSQIPAIVEAVMPEPLGFWTPEHVAAFNKLGGDSFRHGITFSNDGVVSSYIYRFRCEQSDLMACEADGPQEA